MLILVIEQIVNSYFLGIILQRRSLVKVEAFNLGVESFQQFEA